MPPTYLISSVETDFHISHFQLLFIQQWFSSWNFNRAILRKITHKLGLYVRDKTATLTLGGVFVGVAADEASSSNLSLLAGDFLVVTGSSWLSQDFVSSSSRGLFWSLLAWGFILPMVPPTTIGVLSVIKTHIVKRMMQLQFSNWLHDKRTKVGTYVVSTQGSE